MPRLRKNVYDRRATPRSAPLSAILRLATFSLKSGPSNASTGNLQDGKDREDHDARPNLKGVMALSERVTLVLEKVAILIEP